MGQGPSQAQHATIRPWKDMVELCNGDPETLAAWLEPQNRNKVAVCLIWIVARDVELARPAHAAGQDTRDVNIVRVGGFRIMNGTLPVSVRGPVATMEYEPMELPPRE